MKTFYDKPQLAPIGAASYCFIDTLRKSAMGISAGFSRWYSVVSDHVYLRGLG